MSGWAYRPQSPRRRDGLPADERPGARAARIRRYQIASTHSGWSMNGFRLPW
jgi:hypothetical protein